MYGCNNTKDKYFIFSMSNSTYHTLPHVSIKVKVQEISKGGAILHCVST